MSELLKAIKEFIEAVAPAIAVALWNYEQSQVQEAKNEALDAKVKLEIKENHESVDQKYHDCSDLDVVNDAISEGGNGQSGAGGEDGNGAPKA